MACLWAPGERTTSNYFQDLMYSHSQPILKTVCDTSMSVSEIPIKGCKRKHTKARVSMSPLQLECPGDAEKAIGGNTCLGLSVAFHCKMQCPMVRACLHLIVGPREQLGTRGRCWKLLVCFTLHSTVEAETPELLTAAGRTWSTLFSKTVLVWPMLLRCSELVLWGCQPEGSHGLFPSHLLPVSMGSVYICC